MLAHVAGIPVEEMAFSLVPLTVLALSLGIALAKERTRRRAHRQHHTAVQGRGAEPGRLRPGTALDRRVAAGFGDQGQ